MALQRDRRDLVPKILRNILVDSENPINLPYEISQCNTSKKQLYSAFLLTFFRISYENGIRKTQGMKSINVNNNLTARLSR